MDHTRAAVRRYDLSFPYFALSIACSKYTTYPCRSRTLSICLSSVSSTPAASKMSDAEMATTGTSDATTGRPIQPLKKANSMLVSFLTALTTNMDATYAKGFVRGVVDSLDFAGFLSYCLRSEGVLVPTAKCFAMNVALVLTVAIFGSLTAGTGLEWIVLVSWQLPMRLATDVCGFYGWSLYPSMFYAAQHEKNRRRRTQARKVQTSGSYVGEKALRTLMQIAATLLKVAVTQVPLVMSATVALFDWVGITNSPWLNTPLLLLIALFDWVLITPVCFLLDALVYSFFCFECRLEQQGRVDSHGVTHPFKLSQLLNLFESCWTYYAGYGFVQHFGQRLLVSLGMPLWANCLYAAIMPMNVVTTLDAAPGPAVPVPLPLFSRMCVFLGQRLARLGPKSRRATAAVAAASEPSKDEVVGATAVE
jgi:hypothetical protein